MQNIEFSQQGLHVMSKPIGPICNLDCEYCYYLHKEELYPSGESWRMPTETLETYIQQYIEAQPDTVNEITFAWQGGEPTLLGVDFFRKIVELQKKYQPVGRQIVNSLQTNGVLLNDEWCSFFREHNWLIGLSIDGPAELHDRYRYDKSGRGSFEAVMNGLKLLKNHNVEFNVLVVVNRHNGDHGKKIYTYLRDNGVQFIQFIPIVEKRGVGVHAEDPLPEDHNPKSKIQNPQCLVSSRSVLPEQLGDFLIEVFNEWLKRDVGKVFVQIFDQALAAWTGMEPTLCVFRKQCGRALAIEHNGDLFSCDHYVEPEYKLGNINELSIIEMANSAQQRQFGEEKETSLPQYCRDCEVRFVCNGECPKNRFIQTPEGEEGLNYLCAGYRKFFNHIDPVMKQMAEEIQNRRPAANVMHRLNAERRTKKSKANLASASPRLQTPGSPRPAGLPNRNDPCPCGSGKKYKKCCMRS